MLNKYCPWPDSNLSLWESEAIFATTTGRNSSSKSLFQFRISNTTWVSLIALSTFFVLFTFSLWLNIELHRRRGSARLGVASHADFNSIRPPLMVGQCKKWADIITIKNQQEKEHKQTVLLLSSSKAPPWRQAVGGTPLSSRLILTNEFAALKSILNSSFCHFQFVRFGSSVGDF